MGIIKRNTNVLVTKAESLRKTEAVKAQAAEDHLSAANIAQIDSATAGRQAQAVEQAARILDDAGVTL